MADKKFFKYLNDGRTERLRFKVITLKGKVIDIVVQYEALIENKWRAIVRYDCAHGYFHRDLMMPDGSMDKLALPFDELKSALNYAEQDLKDNWENYRKVFLKRYEK